MYQKSGTEIIPIFCAWYLLNRRSLDLRLKFIYQIQRLVKDIAQQERM